MPRRATFFKDCGETLYLYTVIPGHFQWADGRLGYQFSVEPIDTADSMEKKYQDAWVSLQNYEAPNVA